MPARIISVINLYLKYKSINPIHLLKICAGIYSPGALAS